MYAEEEHHPGQPLNEEGNVRDGVFWVDLNESQDNKSKLKNVVNKLRF